MKLSLIVGLFLIIITMFFSPLSYGESTLSNGSSLPLNESSHFSATELAPSLFSATLRAVLSSILIIGLFIFLMYFWRQIMKKREMNFLKRPFSIVNRLPLDSRKFIYLVRVGEKILVLGVGQEIHLLCVLKEEEAANFLENEAKNSLKMKDFSKYLKKTFFSLKSKEIKNKVD